jgi:hypothetical protein
MKKYKFRMLLSENESGHEIAIVRGNSVRECLDGFEAYLHLLEEEKKSEEL